MEVFEALPEGDALGAVIVIQEAFGLNDHIKDVTRRVARAGYHAAAPGLFHRSGGGIAPYDDFSKVLPLFEGLTDEGFLIDLDAARRHLKAADWRDSHIGAVGFCMGGRVSFLLAARRSLGAVVGFYGGGIVNPRRKQFPALVGEAASLKSPWLGLFGDLDQSIPVSDVEQLKIAVQAAPVPTEIVRYADSGHGFFCNDREDYNEEAAVDSWRRTLEWFQKHLQRRLKAGP